MEWTEDIVEKLTQLWAEGYTAQKIADMMQTTKGTIIGKVHRLQLPSRVKPANLCKKEKPVCEHNHEHDHKCECGHECKCKHKKVDEHKSPCIEIKETSIGGHADTSEEIAINDLYKESVEKDNRCHSKYGKTLYELKHDECHWPIGDPKSPEFHFCGEKTVNGKPYCAKHCAFAYVTIGANKDLKNVS